MINYSNSKFKYSALLSLWGHISRHRQKQFGIVLILMIFASMVEIISIGAVFPFLGVLTAPEQVYQHHLMQTFNHLFSIDTPEQLLLPITIVFIGASLFAAAIRLMLLYIMTRISFAVGAELSINIYHRTLHQDYAVHVSRNSSEIINGITSKTGTVVKAIIIPIMRMISSSIVTSFIIFAIFTINFEVALGTLLIFSTLYFLIARFSRRRLLNNSEIIALQSTKVIKSLQEGLGGIRDVLIDNTQNFYCNLYQTANNPALRAAGNNIFIGESPRFILETMGIIIISSIAYSMSLRGGGLIEAIPMLGALALAAQRLLPALQQIYASYSTMKGSYASFEDAIILLNQPLPNYKKHLHSKPIPFKKEIKLNNLNFRYKEDSFWVLKNVNLSLKKGTSIGFIGMTGVGKSTLVDIIMGLLPATEGKLIIDNQAINSTNRRAWQAHISHVPQNIYLSDSTIEENIAFGIEKDLIDHQQVKKSAQLAQIAELIEGWKDGYQTFVGERGIRLSGGQRQRIGIARALYKKANVLIFDEATSALDNETEQAVMDAIEGLDEEITILIIAHRLTTLKGCDKIVKLDKDYVIHTGSYKEMFNR
jgi:ATP-binding cassette, subfamily B, bacterial PglK